MVKKGNSTLFLGLAVILVVAYAFGAFAQWGYPGFISLPTGPVTINPTPTPTQQVVLLPAIAHYTIKDAINGTDVGASATAYVDWLKADTSGLFDPLQTFDTQEYASTPDYSSEAMAVGDSLIMHVSSDRDAGPVPSGDEMYSRWFYVKSLNDGAPIKELTMAQLQVAQTSPSYKYSLIDSGVEVGSVMYLGGTTPYWDFGSFKLYSRTGNTDVTQSITYRGTTAATLTDGASWEDVDSELTDLTLSDDYEDVNIELIADLKDCAWGLPQMYVAQNGKISQYNAFVTIAFNVTTAGMNDLSNDGWTKCNAASLYSGAAYYKMISPQVPDRGATWSLDIPVSIDASAMGTTVFRLDVWVNDVQLESNIATGTISTSLPAVNGFIGDVGPDTITQPLAMTFSSGAPATPQMRADITPV